MAAQNLIHVKLNYDELLVSKKKILSTEANLIRILQRMDKYKSLRNQELKLKTKLLKKLKETKTGINKLEKTLPIIKMPEILKSTKKIKEEAPKKDNLNLELEEIQRKLKQLER